LTYSPRGLRSRLIGRFAPGAAFRHNCSPFFTFYPAAGIASLRVQKKQRQQTEFKALLAKKKRESKQLELEKERLLDLYQSGRIALAEIEPRLKSLRSKIKKSQDECALLEKEEKEESHRLQLIEQFADFTQRMKANLTRLNFEERRQIVRLLVEKVIVNTQTDEITVRHILPLDQKFPLCKGSIISAYRN
jgi:septal ring factor EnvC (AmiA/AmiB activator)